MKLSKMVGKFRVDKPDRFRLSDYDPADTCGVDIDKAEAKAMLANGIERLARLQEKLYAQDRWAVLVVLQGMDAAGKDSAIEHVMSGVNPQGCEVHAFKPPGAEELDQDFLWRAAARLPRRGRIGIFNRSYYEEVLVVRVHPDLVERQRLPKTLVTEDLWDERFKSIHHFEQHLARNGVLILKFFLHISKEEQRKRFLARLEEPATRWKFNMDDVAERKRWDAYMDAYEDAIRHTSARQAPWYVVPADSKPFGRLIIAEAIVEAMEELKLEHPRIEGAALKELKKVRRALEREKRR